MPMISFDNKDYDTDTLSDQAKNLLRNLTELDKQIHEKKNIRAIFVKAQRAYITELKQEMLQAKAGFDFTSV